MAKTKTKRKAAAPAPPIDKWEVENAADNLLRAEEIKAKPGLMKEVKKELTRRKRAIDKIKK